MNQGGCPEFPFPQPQSELTTVCRRGLESTYELLGKMSLRELQTIHEDPNAVDHLLEESGVLRAMETLVEETREKVIKAAEENLALVSSLEEARRGIETRSHEMASCRVKYEELSRVYDELCAKYNPHSIARLLIQSVANIDEESERIAERFLTGGTDLDNFLEEYISRRTASHAQKIKYEKLTSQLEKLHQAGF